jgi:hypothetical protein
LVLVATKEKSLGGAALMHIKKVMRANVQTTTLLCKKYDAKEFTHRALKARVELKPDFQ